MLKNPFGAAILMSGLLAAAVVPAVAAAARADGVPSAMQTSPDDSLEGPIWRLESYKADGKDQPPISSRNATLRFERGKIACTRKACAEPKGVMEQEPWVGL